MTQPAKKIQDACSLTMLARKHSRLAASRSECRQKRDQGGDKGQSKASVGGARCNRDGLPC